MAQMVADANIDGVPIVFAWPSEGRETGYVADKDAAAFSRDQLAALLTTLARKPGFGRVDVLGHSMGGWLTMEALRQLRADPPGRDHPAVSTSSSPRPTSTSTCFASNWR